ncbi:hypothetical protein N657DRAFT_452003 [Parathielavia appendiculata]|uniref:Secreted protein n=1 Tax=Parathielavia appendiculata TaxID=2587402 RepID=A0AAN6Z2U3_9PEZI|nr:hypothetical protein N657DRAFT_452003 [Parathielavia appendiculata]
MDSRCHWSGVCLLCMCVASRRILYKQQQCLRSLLRGTGVDRCIFSPLDWVQPLPQPSKERYRNVWAFLSGLIRGDGLVW